MEFKLYHQQNVLQTPKHKLLKLQIKKHYFCIEQKQSPTIAQENTRNKYQGICIGKFRLITFLSNALRFICI